jgi:hypothetical protein
LHALLQLLHARLLPSAQQQQVGVSIHQELVAWEEKARQAGNASRHEQNFEPHRGPAVSLS